MLSNIRPPVFFFFFFFFGGFDLRIARRADQLWIQPINPNHPGSEPELHLLWPMKASKNPSTSRFRELDDFFFPRNSHLSSWNRNPSRSKISGVSPAANTTNQFRFFFFVLLRLGCAYCLSR